MEAAFTVLIFVYTRRKKTWIKFLKLFNYLKTWIRFHKPLWPWQKQSTVNRLLKPGKEKSAYGMSTL